MILILFGNSRFAIAKQYCRWWWNRETEFVLEFIQ